MPAFSLLKAIVPPCSAIEKDGDLFSKEDAKKLDNIKRKVLDTGKPQRATLELKISGEARYYDLMVRPIGEDQKITGIACSSIDITDLVAAEKELKTLKDYKNGR